MSDLVTADDTTLIDLSIGLEDGVASEPTPPNIDAFDHETGAERLAETLREQGYDVEADDFPDGMGLAWEDLEVIPHAGTHPDDGNGNATDDIGDTSENGTGPTNGSLQNTTDGAERAAEPALEANETHSEESGTETAPRPPATATVTLPTAMVGRRFDPATEATDTAVDC